MFEVNCPKYKLVLLGDSTVGKTSIVNRYTTGSFDMNSYSTLGATFKIMTQKIGSRQIAFNIWDTAGQERFRSITNMYYRDSDIIMIVYDVTSMRTFQNCESWLKEILTKTELPKLMVLVGNKIDLSLDRAVPYLTAKNYAHNHNMLYMECSAKSSVNVEEIFQEIGTIIIGDNREEEETVVKHTIQLHNVKKRKKCCK